MSFKGGVCILHCSVQILSAGLGAQKTFHCLLQNLFLAFLVRCGIADAQEELIENS